MSQYESRIPFTIQWTPKAIADGRSLDSTQREHVREVLEFLREHGYGYPHLMLPNGILTYQLRTLKVQIIFYVVGKHVHITDILNVENE